MSCDISAHASIACQILVLYAGLSVLGLGRVALDAILADWRGATLGAGSSSGTISTLGAGAVTDAGSWAPLGGGMGAAWTGATACGGVALRSWL